MKKQKITKNLARRLALNAQFLDGNSGLPQGKEGVAQAVETLGYIQIDTISVIKRSHHHTLWTRLPDYDEADLHDLQAKDRRLFEYWGHAMSYLPMSDYRYYLPKMRNFENPTSGWAKMSLEKCGHLMESVLERIRQEGLLGARDFEPPPGRKGGTWWDWKPAKIALEMLLWKGDLMISERRNFQKVYDLTERVLPPTVDTTHPDNDELGRFIVRRALSAHGIAQEKEIRSFIQPEASRDSDIQMAGREAITKSINDLIQAEEVIPLSIEEDENADYFALSKTIQRSKNSAPPSSNVFLLSPFDNLIIQRHRTKRLFGFDYALECYVPEPKRKYGYFVLPVLWGQNFVGRLDPKVDRKQKTLIIRNLVFEPHFKDFDPFLPAFAAKLDDFARFNECDRIVFEKVSPVKIKTALKSRLKTRTSPSKRIERH
ncbi:MAG: crosslink repair DNA glycosylase YcaQ family protein [bacterium]